MGPPAAILSARTESMEKDAPKGEPFGIPTNLGCLLLWFSTSSNCPSVAVKKPPVFCGPLFVRRFSCPISRRLPRSDIGGTHYSVRRWEQSEPDGGGQALPKERTTERGSCPLWVYKGPCPLLALSPISVHTEMGPPEGVVAKSALPRASFGRPRPASLLLLSPANPLRWALPGPRFRYAAENVLRYAAEPPYPFALFSRKKEQKGAVPRAVKQPLDGILTSGQTSC